MLKLEAREMYCGGQMLNSLDSSKNKTLCGVECINNLMQYWQ